MYKLITLMIAILAMSSSCPASDGWSYSLGWSPVFVNMIDRVSSTDDRKTGAMGTLHPYVFQASLAFHPSSQSMIEPFLAASLLPRKNKAGDTEERLLILGVRYGRHLGSSSSGGWDWNLGTGIWKSTLKGNGSRYVDPNGATYYVPGSESSSQLIFASTGVGYNWEHFELGPDLYFLDFLHNKKRSYNLMLNFLWRGGK